MNFLEFDPAVERLPPEKIQITALNAEPYKDGRRIRIQLQLTPFQLPPCLELTIMDPQGIEVGSTFIIEPAEWIQELTMHLISPNQVPAKYKLAARLYYPEGKDLDVKEIKINIPVSISE